MERITFVASLPEIQSAISIGGDGARLKLDVPESEIAAIVKLAAYGRSKLLEITIRGLEIEIEPKEEPHVDNR